MSTPETALTKPSAFIQTLATSGLSEEILHAAKRSVVDWYAGTVAGGVLPPATLLCDALAEEIGRGQALLIPSGQATSVRTAALINGTAAHAVEVDDIYRWAIYHPGPPVIAAALAAAQARKLDGKRFLAAVVAGYEVSNRIGAAIQPAHYEYWHTTGTVGTFGAAAAVACALGLDAERAAHALGNAGTFAAALQQAFRTDTMAKPMHAGKAAENGATMALAAERGVTGALDMLEGARGFGAAMGGNPDWTPVFDDLGSAFTIQNMTQKNHFCCGHTFAALDAVLALREAHGLSLDNVAVIHVGSYQKALEICGNWEPDSTYEAKFSLPYAAAVVLKTGRTARFDAFSAEQFADRSVWEFMPRVVVSVDDAAEAAFPARRSATVRIETTDGRTVEHYSPTRKGDPDAPLSDADLNEKFLELVVPVAGEGPARRLLDALWRIDEITDLGSLPPLTEARLAS